mmetsp:Transcript_5062/g.9876  ORF Transcript_5062/g.9876 Transcript_5062/m.9876 type:complete len:348 (-) Transcript_5062:329-1372(-)
MGNACAKGPPREEEDDNKAPGEKAGFRDRRLSVSQVPSDKGSPNRRLSVYNEDSEPPAEVLADISSVAVKSVAGMEPVPGGATRKINQDRALTVYPYMGNKNVGLMGCFDGHGKQGEKASQFVIENLPTILSDLPELQDKPAEALKKAFVMVDKKLGEKMDASVSGTTAVVALMRGDTMWVANAGDSRAIVARRGPNGSLLTHDLTQDQKPDSPAEKMRIEKMGGRVSPAAADGTPARVWHNFRGLAMARSIGDHNAKAVGVIAEPEVTHYSISKDDAMMIMASDGVWEFLSSQDVCDIAASVEDGSITAICDLIVLKAAERWEEEEGDYRDDITAVVITFPWVSSA